MDSDHKATVYIMQDLQRSDHLFEVALDKSVSEVKCNVMVYLSHSLEISIYSLERVSESSFSMKNVKEEPVLYSHYNNRD